MRVLSTIPLSHVMPVLHELERMGHTRERVFEEAGLGASGALANHKDATLPALEFIQLYNFAFRLLEAETSQRTDHSRLSKDVVDMMYYCVITCGNLAEVIQRIVTFNEMIGPLGCSFELIQHDSVVRLVIDLRRRKRDTASLLLELVTINLYHQLLSWLIGERIRLLGASVTHSLPENFIPMANLLVVPIQYSQPSSELVFSAHYLQRPVVRSYGELRQVIDYFPFDIWYSGHVGGGLSDRVRIVLMAALQRQLRLPASEAVAQLFHMSVATLQRRLQAENTSYAKIRADCQRECAEYLLTFTELTVQEIGVQLGFSDDRAFRRAFHSWNGASPAQFRCAQPVEAST